MHYSCIGGKNKASTLDIQMKKMKMAFSVDMLEAISTCRISVM